MTHTLFIDEGNSRIKYWLDADGEIRLAGHLQELSELQLPENGMAISQIVVATVKCQEALMALLKSQFGQATKVTWVSVNTNVLATQYQAPAKLGIDRWLGVLAARFLGSTAAIVVDAGTAITVDVLQQEQGHIGGYILPGLAMQQASLAAHTARVRFPEADWLAESLGVDTAGAVGHGSVRSLCALVREMVVVGVDGQRPDVYLTGGNASDLARFLPEARIEKNLVQIGMQAILYERGAGT